LLFFKLCSHTTGYAMCLSTGIIVVEGVYRGGKCNVGK
jgi:hypothetical protein